MENPDDTLLKGAPSKTDPLTYYFSGIRFLNKYLMRFSVPKWVRKTVALIDTSFTTTDCKQVDAYICAAFGCLDKGGVRQLPCFLSDWQEISTYWSGGTNQTLYIPTSHCLKILFDQRKKIRWPNNFKLAFGIIFGEIGAAIYKARIANVEDDFRNEFEDVFVRNASVKSILDLHYMFSLSSNLFLNNYSPKLLGSASGQLKAPDIHFENATKSFSYYLEATRKEPLMKKAEKDMVSDAVKEKIKKIKPGNSSICSPLIISTDITSSDLTISNLVLNSGNFIPNATGRYIYRCYNDPALTARFQLLDSALSVAAVLCGDFRSKGYDIAGILVTRNQLLKIDSEGLAQAEGGFLIIHRDFENKIPELCATNIYVIDDTCVPQGFVP